MTPVAELEEPPLWGDVASALVLGISVLAAAHLVPILALLPFLIASSFGRRLSSRAVEPDDADVIDAWIPPAEPRVVLARGRLEAPRLEVLVFDTVEAAERFHATLPSPTAVVAGHAPVARDALPSLRFVGIALAFVGTGTWLGAFTLVFFVLGAHGLLRARQVVVTGDRVLVRGLFGTRSYAKAEAAALDPDELVPVGAIRDRLLAAPTWLEGARARALAAISRPAGD